MSWPNKQRLFLFFPYAPRHEFIIIPDDRSIEPYTATGQPKPPSESCWRIGTSQTMNSHSYRQTGASQIMDSPIQYGQDRSRRRRTRAYPLATSSCAAAAAAAGVLLSLASPAKGFGIFSGATYRGTDGARRPSYGGAGVGRRGEVSMRSTLAPPVTSPTSTETIDGGTQTVREMGAQMSQVSCPRAGSR